MSKSGLSNPTYELDVENVSDGKAVVDSYADKDPYGEHEDLNEEVTGCMRYVEMVQNGIIKIYEENNSKIKWAIFLFIIVILHIYEGMCIWYSFEKAKALFVLTCLAWFFVFYYYVLKKTIAEEFYFTFYVPFEEKCLVIWKFVLVRAAVYIIILAAIIVFLAFDTKEDRFRLVSLGGLACYIVILFLFSTNPSRVNWRPVVWGILIQFVLGLLVLRWKAGSDAFEWASNQIVIFLDYTNAGTSFVYGFLAAPPESTGLTPVFAFTQLQVVIYFGAIVSVLYYFGAMQAILTRIAWLMQLTMGTTATESLNAAACIFLGQAEAPLLIKPYLSRMTASELHAVMTGGFACIAGSLFAAYIAFGACPPYLLSATIMSAPASLAVSKLFYPETEHSQLKRIEDLELPKGEERNALEAVSNGATAAVELVWAIIANLIVFLAILAFIDSIVGWFVGMIGYEGWTFERLMGYIFFPFAFVMGASDDPDWDVKIDQTLKVAELMGTKTVLNEFIAYKKMAAWIQCGKIRGRAQMIATYALCGFSNIGSIGIQLGILGGMCPQKKPVLSRIVVRALVAGSIACFMTACMAGLLVEVPISCPPKNDTSVVC